MRDAHQDEFIAKPEKIRTGDIFIISNTGEFGNKFTKILPLGAGFRKKRRGIAAEDGVSYTGFEPAEGVPGFILAVIRVAALRDCNNRISWILNPGV